MTMAERLDDVVIEGVYNKAKRAGHPDPIGLLARTDYLTEWNRDLDTKKRYGYMGLLKADIDEDAQMSLNAQVELAIFADIRAYEQYNSLEMMNARFVHGNADKVDDTLTDEIKQRRRKYQDAYASEVQNNDSQFAIDAASRTGFFPEMVIEQGETDIDMEDIFVTDQGEVRDLPTINRRNSRILQIMNILRGRRHGTVSVTE